jgi:hypothetical protein
MTARLLLVLLSLLFCPIAGHAVLPPKNVEYKGRITAVTPKDITVQGKNSPRVFLIYPGTVFGAGARQKLADFKPGGYVTVVFSEITGIVKAENIRTTAPPKPKAPPAPPKKMK